jgi:16S rRNA (cytidine(1402)-2'-O)-methyltransferase
MQQQTSGTLYCVPTPIGNLEDITLRALRILREVDAIVCEDTRQTVKLLNHYEIQKPLISFYTHNQVHRLPHIIEMLRSGKNCALVSDSGTPGLPTQGRPGCSALSLETHRQPAESKAPPGVWLVLAPAHPQGCHLSTTSR